MVVETVAECKCNKEAIKLIESFSKRDPAAFYYVQKAPCKAWLDINSD